jgi:hypothetical protein
MYGHPQGRFWRDVPVQGFYGWYHIMVQVNCTTASKFVFNDQRQQETKLEIIGSGLENCSFLANE